MRHRKAGVSVLLGTLLLFATSPLQSGQARIATPHGDVPPIIRSVDPEQPWAIFVSADEAVTSTGELRDLAMHHPAAADTIRHILRQQPDAECIRVSEVYDSGTDFAERSNLDQAVRTSRVVAVSTVTGSLPGFEHGVPGTMYRLSVDRSLKGEPVAELFVFIPVATFQVASTFVCKTDTRYPEPPAIGDQVIVLLERLREEAPVPYAHLPENGTGIIVLPSGRGPQFPRKLLHERLPATNAQVIARVADLAGKP